MVACHSVWDQDEYRGTVPRIRVNSMAMGEAAAHGLLRLIKDPGVRVQETIPVELAATPPAAAILNPPPKAVVAPPNQLLTDQGGETKRRAANG